MGSKNEKVAKRYARALFDASQASDYEAVQAFLDKASKCWHKSGSLRAAMQLPTLSLDERSNLLDGVLSGVSKIPTETTEKLLKLLASANRVDTIPEISKFFSAYVREYLKLLSVEVISAHELSDAEKQAISAELTTKLAGQVVITWSVQPEQIGGLVMRVGDRMVDRSVLGALQDLKSHIV